MKETTMGEPEPKGRTGKQAQPAEAKRGTSTGSATDRKNGRRRVIEWPPKWVIVALAGIIAAPDLLELVPERERRNPERTINLRLAPLTPFHHHLARAGWWDISKETAKLIPKTFDEAVAFLESKATEGPPLWFSGAYDLGAGAEERATTDRAKKAIRALRSSVKSLFPGETPTRGAAFTIRLDGTGTETFDTHVQIHLYETEHHGERQLLVSAIRYDGRPFYPG